MIREGIPPRFRVDPNVNDHEIIEHPLFHINDYSFFKENGYSDDEILQVWDTELNQGIFTPNDWDMPTLQPQQPLEQDDIIEFGTMIERAYKAHTTGNTNIFKFYISEANNFANKYNYADWSKLAKKLSENKTNKRYNLWIDNELLMSSENKNDLQTDHQYWQSLGHEAIIVDTNINESIGDEYYRDPVSTKPREGNFKQDFRVGDEVETALGSGVIVDVYWKTSDYIRGGIPIGRTNPYHRVVVQLDNGEMVELDTLNMRHR
jgi:hypothetical protein